MKKITSLLCAAVTAVCTCASILQVPVLAAAVPTITISSVQAEPGESIQVPVTITGNAGICGAEITIHYDSALSLSAAANGTAFSGMSYTAPGDLTANPVNLLWDNTDPINTDGQIAVLTFTAPETDGTYNISATIDDGDIVDGDLNPVNPQIVNGSITVGSTEERGLRITEQPVDVTAGLKAAISFSVKAEEAVSYQWQYTTNGTKWYNSSAASAKTETLTVSVSKSNYINKYRCAVKGADGTVIYSDIAKIDLIPWVNIIEQPESPAMTLGETVNFHVEAENVAEGGYQWQYSKNGKTWYNSGATGNNTDTLSIKVKSSNLENMYRCQMVGIDGNKVNSKSAVFVILTEQPKPCTAAVGTMATYSLKAEGATAYQWYYSKNDGKTWYKSTATGCTTDTITFKATTSNRTTIYRCKFTTVTGIFAYTKPVGFAEGMKIVTQPVSVSATIGQKVSFTVEATGVSKYQWYYSKDDGTTWAKTSATGATTETLTVTKSETNKNYKYRCKLTGVDGVVQYTDAVGI